MKRYTTILTKISEELKKCEEQHKQAFAIIVTEEAYRELRKETFNPYAPALEFNPILCLGLPIYLIPNYITNYRDIKIQLLVSENRVGVSNVEVL